MKLLAEKQISHNGNVGQ